MSPINLILVRELVERGWLHSGSRWLSPHATLWLPVDVLYWLTPEALEREALGRLKRRKRSRKAFRNVYDAERAIDDAESLVEALRATLEQTAPQLAQAG